MCCVNIHLTVYPFTFKTDVKIIIYAYDYYTLL